MATPKFTYPPPRTQYCLLSFPAPFVLLVTLNRPRDLNCINGAGHVELDAVWSWMDREPSLRVGIVTGAGRAFCAGADLKGEIFLASVSFWSSLCLLSFSSFCVPLSTLWHAAGYHVARHFLRSYTAF